MNPKPDKILPAVYGGVIMGLLSAIPFVNLINCLCCAGVIIGGICGVYFYKNNFTPDTPPFSSGDCLAVGAMAGVVGAFVATVLSLFFDMMFGDVMQEFVRNAIANSNIELPEEFADRIDEAFGAETSAFMVLSNLALSLFIDPLFGLLGGLIGYGVFKPKQGQQSPPPPPMPLPS